MEKYSYSAEARAVLEGMQQPLAIYQLVDGQIVTLVLSDGFCRLCGYEDRQQAMDDMDHDMFKDTHPDDRERVARAAQQFADGGETYDVVFRTKAGMDGGFRIIHGRGKHVITETGARVAQVWYMDEGEYTEGAGSPGAETIRLLNSSLHEESILQAAHYDELTGLSNLSYFFKQCEIGKARVFSKGKQGVLLYMDLAGMKYFNHKHGFAEGDRLLKAFAELLAQIFGKEDCCHIGADRFAVSTTEDRVEAQVRQLLEKAGQINSGNNLPVRVGIYSTGIEDVPVSTAYDRAKLACETLQKTNASGFRFYTKEMSAAVKRRQYIQNNIDRAIAEKWIQVYYQPIVRAVSGRVCDEEALARWIDPAEGFLSPAEFIPHLEASGQIYKLDLYMLEQVLDKIRSQEQSGLVAVPQSINLSRSDFDDCDIVEEIRKRVDESGVSRDKITIEITESIVGSDPDFMKEQIARFRALGFPVWMDDFGSGYSSLDVLQSIPFDLIKFDMSFMRKLDEGESGKIILTELMKMATALGLDTVCEGVETEAQMRFLQEVGCSKLQGYFFCKPIPFEGILERYEKGTQIGFEDPETSVYFETVGRINLYDLGVIASQEEHSFQHAFDTLPMGIIEVKGDSCRYVRSNPSYREFMRRFFGIEMAGMTDRYTKYGAAFMNSVVRTCCEQGIRSFYDETMPDGSVVHSFARRIGINPVTGDTAVAVAVLSITDPDENASYSEIARALASDYYNIYVVDMDSEKFIEYTSKVGRDELAIERHGTEFFESARRDTMQRIFADDREFFLAWFTKENISKELTEQGVFTLTYRLIDTGTPVYVNLKITRIQGTRRIILGVSVIDSQMKQQMQFDSVLKERDALARVMAISEDYISLYSVHADTGRYVEYTASSDYESLGFAKEGEDFFRQGIADGLKTVHREDLPQYLAEFTKENVLAKIRQEGKFLIHYRLIIQGQPRPVCLKIMPFQDGTGKKLLAGVRKWRDRSK